jgi:hypothetical protein
MSETEEYSPPRRDGERGILELEESAVDAEQRQIESSRTKLGVLIGSGILQLPIWGTFTCKFPFKALVSNLRARLCDELWCVPAILL